MCSAEKGVCGGLGEECMKESKKQERKKTKLISVIVRQSSESVMYSKRCMAHIKHQFPVYHSFLL